MRGKKLFEHWGRAVQPGIDETGELVVNLDSQLVPFSFCRDDVAEDEMGDEVAVPVQNGKNGCHLVKEIQDTWQVTQPA